jgi:hypothetical protein
MQVVQPVSEFFHLPAAHAVVAPSYHEGLGMDPKREGYHHGDEQDVRRLSRSRAGTPALLNLKQCCVNVRAFEIRILASSIEKQLVLDAFMQI